VSIPLERLEGKYEILEKIKEGGMGAIYKVRHRLLEEVRVIKVIRPQLQKDESLRARFVREARNAIRLRHANIAQLYDFTMDDEGNAFIVMEYIEGLTLDELLRRHGPVPLPLALEIAVQALGALGYLHRKGLVHRDVSPDNLMLAREDDGAPLVKLIDLGLAKGLQDESGLTVQGTFLGKVRYASPEQLRTSEGIKLDQRSDIYSFGVVLYQLVTGVLPIRGDSLTPLIAGHLFDAPVPFEESDRGGRVPERLREALLRCLAKSPGDRFQDAAELAAALAELQRDHPVTARDVRAAFVSPEDETARIPIVRPGSTQARLDRQFGNLATPPPADGETLAEARGPAAAPPPETSRAMRLLQEVEASTRQRSTRPAAAGPEPASLVLEARILAEVGDWDGARAQLERAAAIAPESSQVTRLLAEARARSEPPPPPGGSVAAAAADAEALRVAEVEAALAAGDPAAARLRLEAALAASPSVPALADLGRRVAKAEERARQERIRSLLSRARAEVEEQHYDGGIALLEEALAIAPEDTIIKRVLVRTREERDQRAEEAAREAAAGLALAQAEALLEEGELDEAEVRLDAAVAEVGERAELAAVRARIREAKEAGRRRAAAAEAVATAREALARGELGAAEAAMAQAGELAGGDAEVMALGEEVAARAGEESSRRRAAAVEDAAGRIAAALDSGDTGAAAQALGVAEKLFGGDERIVGLRRRLDEFLRRRRREAVEALAAEANAASDLAGLERSVGKVQAALLEDPDSAELAALLEALRERQAQNAVEACLASGDVAGARHALEVAERMFGDSGTVLILRRKVEAAARIR